MTKEGDKVDRSKNFLWDAVAVFGLFSLSVARPLFELLARNVEFFVFKRANRLEIIIFILALSFLVPSILVLIRFLLSKISETPGNLFQGIILASLTLAFILPGLNRHNWVTNNALIAMLILSCALIGLGYFLFNWLRLFYIYLAPAILIVPLLFLVSPGIYRILFSKPHEIPSVKIHSETPLVFVIFDEFPIISLMDENRQIDEVRYPNFAKLAKEWTWYRSTNSVAERTAESLAGILTGLHPEKGRLPVLMDYPKNLFSLLEKSHRLEVFESLTWMSPEGIVSSEGQELVARWQSLISDLWLVYLHIILPERYLQNLPPVAQSWGDFAANAAKGAADRRSYAMEPTILLNKFLSAIQPSEKPALYFLHVMLPHVPWHLLPSGKDYGSRTYEGMILQYEKWRDDEPAVQRGYQRHLLQVGYVDHWIGRLIQLLQETGLYDKSVIVLVADHGISFKTGGSWRMISKENAEEVIFIPLLIKAPGQRSGKIIDWNVETTDILPTIAELMKFRIPWKVDGVSVASNPPPPERPRLICGRNCQTRHSFESKLFPGGSALKRKLSWFGTGIQDRFFRFGPCSELVGKGAPHSAKPAQNITLKLRQEDFFVNVSLKSNFIPAFVAGILTSNTALPRKIAMGISLNGVFQTTAYSVRLDPKTHVFDALLPESSLRPGYNQMQIYLFSTCDEPPLLLQEEQ